MFPIQIDSTVRKYRISLLLKLDYVCLLIVCLYYSKNIKLPPVTPSMPLEALYPTISEQIVPPMAVAEHRG